VLVVDLKHLFSATFLFFLRHGRYHYLSLVFEYTLSEIENVTIYILYLEHASEKHFHLLPFSL